MLSFRLWPTLLLVLFVVGAVSADDSPNRSLNRKSSLAAREQQMLTPAVHDAQFTEVRRFPGRPRCATSRPPEAIATPNPVLAGADSHDRVTVSFIVGTDGKVHSALVLGGGDLRADVAVLETVRRWRYRPATCNGVPTEVEARVEFSPR